MSRFRSEFLGVGSYFQYDVNSGPQISMVEPLECVLIRCDQRFTKELSVDWESGKGLFVWLAVVMVGGSPVWGRVVMVGRGGGGGVVIVVGAVCVWWIEVTDWKWGWLHVICRSRDDFKATKSMKIFDLTFSLNEEGKRRIEEVTFKK